MKIEKCGMLVVYENEGGVIVGGAIEGGGEPMFTCLFEHLRFFFSPHFLFLVCTDE